jgi:hypothetical protein
MMNCTGRMRALSSKARPEIITAAAAVALAIISGAAQAAAEPIFAPPAPTCNVGTNPQVPTSAQPTHR